MLHLRAAEFLDYDYPSLPAILFLQYSRMGNLRNIESANGRAIHPTYALSAAR